jgi:hypothetical protein
VERGAFGPERAYFYAARKMIEKPDAVKVAHGPGIAILKIQDYSASAMVKLVQQ